MLARQSVVEQEAGSQEHQLCSEHHRTILVHRDTLNKPLLTQTVTLWHKGISGLRAVGVPSRMVQYILN